MRSCYFDTASTSFPKAPGVGEAMMAYIADGCGSPGRGAHRRANEAAEAALDLRLKLCARFGGPSPKNVILTPGATHALNGVIGGLLKPGDRAITSVMEHNSVLRPLHQAVGVTTEYLPCDETGALQAGWQARITAGTRLVVLTHASNVCGTILPVGEVGKVCRARGVFFCVDASQTAGMFPIDMEQMCIDALVFPGHKGLLGPQGIGGFVVTDALAAQMTPLVAGGTGSESQSLEMPRFLPDRFEAGTMNMPGVYGLLAALQWREGQDEAALRHRAQVCTGHLLARMGELRSDGLLIPGRPAAERVGVVSVHMPGVDSAEVAFRLEQEYGIQSRCGLHCAPLAHKALGTFPQGTIRFSTGPFTTCEEIDYLQGALCDVLGI